MANTAWVPSVLAPAPDTALRTSQARALDVQRVRAPAMFGRLPVPFTNDQQGRPRRPASADDELAEVIATELTRLRQRGLDRLNYSKDRQRPVATPQLDLLAAAAGYDVQLHRLIALRLYLDSALRRFRMSEPDRADLIRSLFFDEQGRTPGPAGPSGLLASTRKPLHVSNVTFRKLQRLAFLSFAGFLLSEHLEQRLVRGSLRLAVLMIIVALVLLFGAALITVLLRL